MSNPPEADPAAREALADDDGQVRVVAASSEQGRLLELFQLQNDEGPCMQAFASDHLLAASTFTQRSSVGPDLRRTRSGAGYESVYAIPLRLRGNIIGALNLFRSKSGPLSDGHTLTGR